MELTLGGVALVEGQAEGPLLVLSAPISFWGGVDPRSGRIVHPGHPDLGASVAGVVLAVPAAIGSSSSSSVLLELIYRGRAPAALLLGEADAILPLAVVVAREMGYGELPVYSVTMASLPPSGRLRVGPEGRIRVLSTGPAMA